MKKTAIVLAAAFALAACGYESAEERQMAVDTLTRAQKDSLIADMPIPGAGAVGRAIDAAGRAGERTQQHDSIR